MKGEKVLVWKRFKFDAAHYLPDYEGSCNRIHGHTWYLDVAVRGPVGREGFVVDFMWLKRHVRERVVDLLDHRFLNEIRDLPFSANPTCEHILEWVWSQLENDAFVEYSRYTEVSLHLLRLYESSDSWAEYDGKS